MDLNRSLVLNFFLTLNTGESTGPKISSPTRTLNFFLISSKNLTNEELNNLNTELSQAMGTAVAFNYKVDENLIGGLKLQIGSLMVDTSIKNKLKKYEQTMLEL